MLRAGCGFHVHDIPDRGITITWLTNNMQVLFDPGVSVRLTSPPVFSSLPQDEGSVVHEILRDLESQCLSEISAMLSGEIPGDELGDLFFDCVDTEIKFYH